MFRIVVVGPDLVFHIFLNEADRLARYGLANKSKSYLDSLLNYWFMLSGFNNDCSNSKIQMTS